MAGAASSIPIKDVLSMTPQRAGEVFWSLANIAMVADGTWLQQPKEMTKPIYGMSIDTRTMQVGEAYLAIKGDRFDGHKFVVDAIDAGASLVIVSDAQVMKDIEAERGSGEMREDVVGRIDGGEASFNFRERCSDDAGETCGGCCGESEKCGLGAGNGGNEGILESDTFEEGGVSGGERCARLGDVGILLVEDTVKALQSLAKAWRDVLFDCNNKIIAVGGSNGKTTTRHLIHTLLHGRMVALDRSPAVTGELNPPNPKSPLPDTERPDLWRVHQLIGTQSPKSFNNHIGVPLTLLGAFAEDDFTVVEIGTNHPGEVEELAGIVRPDAVVITSIGREHMEFFGSLEGVAKEEATLLSHVRPGGLIVIEDGAAEKVGPFASPPMNHHRMTFGASRDCSLQMIDFEQHADGISFSVKMPGQNVLGPVNVPLIGMHSAINLMAAIAIAKWMGVDDIQLNLGLFAIMGVPGRLQLIPLKQQTNVIHDAYNSNPDSLHASLDILEGLEGPDADEFGMGVLASISPSGANAVEASGGGKKSSHTAPAISKPRTVVLGDMLELGEHEVVEHNAAAHRVREMLDSGEITMAIFVGERMCRAAEPLKEFRNIAHRVHLVKKWEEGTGEEIVKLIPQGQTILLKGSNGVGLGRLIEPLKQKFGE